MEKLKEQLTQNIWAALDDYFRHADSDDVLRKHFRTIRLSACL